MQRRRSSKGSIYIYPELHACDKDDEEGSWSRKGYGVNTCTDVY